MAPSTVQITVSMWIVLQVDCSKYIYNFTPKLNVSCLIMIDRYELTTELGNDMVCDGWGVIPSISLLRMTVVTCLGCGNHVSLNRAGSEIYFGYCFICGYIIREDSGWYKTVHVLHNRKGAKHYYEYLSYWNRIKNKFGVTEKIYEYRKYERKLPSLVAVHLSIIWNCWFLRGIIDRLVANKGFQFPSNQIFGFEICGIW